MVEFATSTIEINSIDILDHLFFMTSSSPSQSLSRVTPWMHHKALLIKKPPYDAYVFLLGGTWTQVPEMQFMI